MNEFEESVDKARNMFLPSKPRDESFLAVRYMSLEEYTVLVNEGRISEETAPFAVINKDDDQSDCDPPTVPLGSVMLWPIDYLRVKNDIEEHETVGEHFGNVRVLFDVPNRDVIWRGEGRYRHINGWGDDEYYGREPGYSDWEEILDEVSVRELLASSIRSVIFQSQDVIKIEWFINKEEIYWWNREADKRQPVDSTHGRVISLRKEKDYRCVSLDPGHILPDEWFVDRWI